MGARNRAIRATERNERSSRSHAILQLRVVVETGANPNGDGPKDTSKMVTVTRHSKLSLVDLAGSEKYAGGTIGKTNAAKTSATMGEGQLREMTHINGSLTALGIVIAALTEKGRKHVPYRSSVLTRILQDSLGGNTRTTLIAAIAPEVEALDETISTLKFANRAKSVMVKVSVNESVADATVLRRTRAALQKLKMKLKVAQQKSAETVALAVKDATTDLQSQLNAVSKERDGLQQQNAEMLDELAQLRAELEKQRQEYEHKLQQQIKETQRQIVRNPVSPIVSTGNASCTSSMASIGTVTPAACSDETDRDLVAVPIAEQFFVQQETFAEVKTRSNGNNGETARPVHVTDTHPRLRDFRSQQLQKPRVKAQPNSGNDVRAHQLPVSPIWPPASPQTPVAVEAIGVNSAQLNHSVNVMQSHDAERDVSVLRHAKRNLVQSSDSESGNFRSSHAEGNVTHSHDAAGEIVHSHDALRDVTSSRNSGHDVVLSGDTGWDVVNLCCNERNDVQKDSTADDPVDAHKRCKDAGDLASHASTDFGIRRSSGANGQLNAWLKSINMGQFEADLKSVGCEIVDDVCDIEMVCIIF